MGIFQEEYQIRVSYTDGTKKEYTQQQEEVENAIYNIQMDALLHAQ